MLNAINQFIIMYGTGFSVIVRIISCITLLYFYIPLQLKEARIENGLKILRLQLLAFGLILLLINFLTIVTLSSAVIDGVKQAELNVILQVINGIGFLALALIGNNIYTRQYSDEMIGYHKKVHELEEKEKKET